MRKQLFLIFCSMMAIFALFYAITPRTPSDENEQLTVSWMTSWATTGQVLVTMENTNALELAGSDAELRSFLFGPEMNEAAVAGRVDVTNTGIVPTANLLAADDDWIIVSRLIYFRVSLLVPIDSQFQSLEDLKGRRVGVPFGGGSHPYMLQRMAENGIDEGTGPDQIQLVNLKPPEQAQALRQGSVDAIATWEPQTAISKSESDARVIDFDTHVGFVSVRRSYAEAHPQDVVELLKAYFLSAFFVAQNQDVAGDWFSEASGFSRALLSDIEEIEPNLEAASLFDVSLALSDDDLARSQAIADLMFGAGLLGREIDIESRYDPTFVELALEELRADSPQALEVAPQIAE